MRNYTSGFLYVAGGILVGAITAYVAANNAGQEALAEGSPWKSRVAALDKAAGIYVQDYYLMAGRLPLAPGQFLEASAAEDSDGNTLSASCSYDVISAGSLPQWWSVAATASGSASSKIQTVIDENTAVREADGSVRIVVSAVPQPGNWLKIASGRAVILHYAAVPFGSRGGRAPPFSIRRVGC
ncbi:MAG: DUF1214 domain-containing protein [Alphaproteobacteria bacterium]|nr:DUF1214 domain-containing protein [Alphaproteobacteria bacterium]